MKIVRRRQQHAPRRGQSEHAIPVRRPHIDPLRAGVHAAGIGGAIALLVESGAQTIGPTLMLGAALILWVLANFATERPEEA